MTANSPQLTANSGVSPLRGWVVTTYTTYKGKKLGPYYSRTWKVKGKIKREYIKPADLERIRAACHANRERRRRGIEIAADFQNTVGNLKWLKTMERRSEKGTLRPEDHDHIRRIETHGYGTPGRTKLRSKRPKVFASQYPTPNTQHLDIERNFMYPSLTNSSPACGGSARRAMGANTAFMKSLKREVKRIFASKFANESIEDKWERWRKEHAKRPAPRTLPKARVNLAVPLDQVDARAQKLSQRLDRSIADGKSAPDWRKLSFTKRRRHERATTEEIPIKDLPPRNFPWEAKAPGWSDRSNHSNLPNAPPISRERDKPTSNQCDQFQLPNLSSPTDRAFSSELSRFKRQSDK